MIPITQGLANFPRDDIEENLVLRFQFAEECIHGAHLLVDRYVAKYGGGLRPADSSKGEKGVLYYFDCDVPREMDLEMNFLFKAFIFSAKSSLDKGFYVLHRLRAKVQPGRNACEFPDPSKSGGFGRFYVGIMEDKFANFHAAATKYYKERADSIIGLRVIRNNLKLYGRPHFERNMERPSWKFILSNRDREDSTLKYLKAVRGVDTPTILTANIGMIHGVICAEVAHLIMLSDIIDIKAESNGFITTEEIDRLADLVQTFRQKIDAYSLRLSLSSSS